MSIQDGLFKYFSGDFSLWQLFVLRGLFAVSMIYLVAVHRDKLASIFREAMTPWVIARSLFMTLMFIAMYASSPFISLSTIAAGIYTAPIFVTLLSAWIIKERVSLIGWIAIFAGFTGVIAILKPGTDVFSFWAMLPVIGGLFYALSNVTTRAKCHQYSSISLTMSLNMTLLLAGLLGSCLIIFWNPGGNFSSEYSFLLSHWFAMGLDNWGLIILLSFFAVIVGLALARAYQVAPAATVATFDYSYLVFVAIWDILFFGLHPDLWSVVGVISNCWCGGTGVEAIGIESVIGRDQ